MSRFRGLARFWRFGVATLVVLVLALGAITVTHRRGGPSTATDRPASAVTGGVIPVSGTAASGYAAAPTTAAAATTAPAVVRPAATAAAGSAVARSSSGASASSDATILSAPLPPQTIDQKIIRTATIQITAKDVVGTQNSIWGLASQLGGNVLTSNTTGTDDNVRADIAFRVPSERFSEAMERVRGFAVKVEKEQSSAQDVTEEYVDLQARQRNLEATVLQFQALLAKATTVDETLKVQAQLNNAQSDLERVKGKMNYYDQRAAFSTIAVTVLPVPPPAKPVPVTPVAKWSLHRSIQEAWNRSVNGLQNVADALITVVIGGWWIEIPLGLAIYFLARRERRRKLALTPAAVPVTTEETGNRAGQTD